MKSRTDDCIIVNLLWILRLKLRDTDNEWVTHSEPIKEAAHFCSNKLFAVVQLTSSSEGRILTNAVCRWIIQQEGESCIQFLNIWLLTLDALFVLLCLHNYRKCSTIKRLEENKQNLVNETSQRCFHHLHHSLTCSLCSWPHRQGCHLQKNLITC